MTKNLRNTLVVPENDDDPQTPKETTLRNSTAAPLLLSKTTSPHPQSWIRGVNLGGWLMMERYITPYQFALTTCHIQGDFCWYPGQINAPPNAPLCDLKKCPPLLSHNVFGKLDYPLDEYSLWKAFGTNNTKIAEEWLNYHLEYFITEQDIVAVKASGATHVRLPLPHWILQSQSEIHAAGEVWLVGQRWQALQRVVDWSRRHGLQVWPDLHTAPGSQNGFDNSGRQFKTVTCQGWSDHPQHVEATLEVLRQVTRRMVDDGMQDVVTGFGLLNEPFSDCDVHHSQVYYEFLEQGLDIVRTNLGPQAHVYVGDLFKPGLFNNGNWWLNAARYNNTYIDSHHYHVFAETHRALSPRQHIALTCQDEYHVEKDPYKVPGGVASCCWKDPPHNTIPSQGVRRMIGEWSVAVDTLPADLLYDMLQHVAQTGTLWQLHRQVSPERQDFLRNFAQAQMVIYEMADQQGLGAAWFFWTVKMEGGAFAEWDYLRGIREGWIPPIPAPTVSSQSLYGSCYEIMARTADNTSILHEFPAPHDIDPGEWLGPILDDDVIVSHGESILHPEQYNASRASSSASSSSWPWWTLPSPGWTGRALGAVLVMACLSLWYICRRHRPRRRLGGPGGTKDGYSPIPEADVAH